MLQQFADKVRRRWPLIAGMLLLWVTVVWLASSPYVQQFQQLYYLVSAFAIMAIGYGLSAREPSKLAARLSESSFFIYALHMATFGGFSLLGGVDGALASLLRAGSSAFGAWCYMFIAPVAVAASAFLLFMLLRRLCPSVLAVLTGGREFPLRRLAVRGCERTMRSIDEAKRNLRSGFPYCGYQEILPAV